MPSRLVISGAILALFASLATGHADSQDAGPRAVEPVTGPPKSLKVAAVQFRSSRDLG